MNNEATPAADLDVYSILLQSLTTVYTNSGYSLVRMKILSRWDAMLTQNHPLNYKVILEECKGQG